MKSISDSTIATIASEAVISITPGWSSEKRPFDGSEFHYNAILAMREGHANAISFRRTDGVKPQARFAVISREDKREMYFTYMHNGIGFKSADSIVENGCTPSRSERQGISLNGSGLVYMASLLGGELVIASKTTDDNQWHAGRCVFNRDANRVDPSQATDIESDLESIFGVEILNDFSVIYMWKITWFEKQEGKREPWSVGDSIRNSLGMMCGNDWFTLVKLNVSGQICRLHDTKYGDPLGVNYKYWLEHSWDKEANAVKKMRSDHKDREVAAPEEIRLRHSVAQWSVVTKPFAIKTAKTEDEITARVTIEAYPGQRAKERGTKDQFSFYKTIRPSPEEYTERTGRSWKSDSISAEGARPVFCGYLSMPLFASAHGGDEVMTRAFSRFEDNSMAALTKIQPALEEMDIFYDADKGDANRNYVSDWHDPYAIVKVEILKLHKRTNRYNGEVQESPSVTSYMDAVDRNPLFLSGLPENVINNIFKAACAAAAPVMREEQPECYKWFEDNFKQKTVDCLPLEGFGGKLGGRKQPKYTCYDIQNAGTFDFDGELKSSSIRYLAVKSNSCGSFVQSLDTTKTPRSEGFKISPIKDGDFSFEDPEICEAYASFKEKLEITGEVTIFKIEVRTRGLKSPGGKDGKGEVFDDGKRSEAEIIDLYKGCYGSPEKEFLVPTRGFHVTTEFSHVERLAVVTDVPKPPSGKAPPPGPGPVEPPTPKKQQINRYCERDSRIPVEVKKGGIVCVNINYPMFKKALTEMPVKPKTLKLGQELYDTVNIIASGIYQTMQLGSAQFEVERKHDKWLVGSSSIWNDDVDYAVNHSLIKMLDLLPSIQEITEKLAELKVSCGE